MPILTLSSTPSHTPEPSGLTWLLASRVLALALFMVMATAVVIFEPALAQTPAPLPASVGEQLAGAHLAGGGSFRFFGFHVYDAQFWVGAQGYQPEHPEAAPFALDLQYARHFTGADIAKTSCKELQRLGLGSTEELDAWTTRMQAIFPDVNEGDHITGLFLPGVGARFFFNGKLSGEVADTRFAHAFFSIWLDPRTKASTLREKMLAGAAPR